MEIKKNKTDKIPVFTELLSTCYKKRKLITQCSLQNVSHLVTWCFPKKSLIKTVPIYTWFKKKDEIENKL